MKYLTLENNVEALRGQMLYRAKNLGVKELDLIVGSWAKNYVHTLNMEELNKFNSQVIQKETPDLLRKLLGYDEIEEDEDFVKRIREFAVDEKYSKI